MFRGISGVFLTLTGTIREHLFCEFGWDSCSLLGISPGVEDVDHDCLRELKDCDAGSVAEAGRSLR